MPTLSTILEGTTPIYSASFLLKDAAGVALTNVTFSAVRLTFYSLHSGAIVNARTNQNVLNANNITISGAGALEWKMLEADTVLADAPKPIIGSHRAVFVFEWFDAQSVARQLVHEVTFTIRRALNAPFTA